MARFTDNMALAVWNLVSDLFDHSAWANNLDKLDAHNHTDGKGLQIPGEGIEDAAIGPDHLNAAALDEIANIIIPTGSVLAFSGSSAPTNFLLCDGSAVSRSTYAALFSLVGTTYGVGDGSTTFNVPNLKGRTIIGVDSGAAVLTAAPTRGTALGEEKHTLITGELPVHTHTINDTGHTHTVSGTNNGGAPPANVVSSGIRGDSVITGGSNYSLATTATGAFSFSLNADNHTTGITLNNNGSGLAHNNLQPSLALFYIIKT